MVSADRYSAWVAGSAAICPSRAGDIDVWILRHGIKPNKFNMDVWTDTTKVMNNDGYDLPLPIFKRIEVTAPADLIKGTVYKVQVMFTGATHIAQVLNRFDCTCHAYARASDGTLVVHPDATLPGSPIGMITYSSLTSERIERFTDRYKDIKKEEIWLPC